MMMDNTVSPETAVRLRECGFPQPAPKPGQYWHDGKDLFWLHWVDGESFQFSEVNLRGAILQTSVVDFGKLTYVPTATDILQQLPEYFLELKDGLWEVDSFDDHGVSWFSRENTPAHANPHEAAALAYLHEKEKP